MKPENGLGLMNKLIMTFCVLGFVTANYTGKK